MKKNPTIIWKNIVYCLCIILISGIFEMSCKRSSSNSNNNNNNSDTAYYQSGGSATLANQTYKSTTSDENAVQVENSGTFTLSNSTITKSGDTASEENSNFNGINAGVLAASASKIYLSDCTITTSGSGANAAFAYGSGSLVNLNRVTISTSANSSRGVDATYGGTINISNSTITTKGAHCAALATDRYDNSTGAPQVIATNCTGSTEGEGSPGIYCTGTFVVQAESGGVSKYTATGSEAAVIEGLNSITLKNTDITGAKKWSVMIYQSNSGDASVGQGTFTMTGGTLTNNSSGPAFFVCNTTSVINLSGVSIVNSSGTLLKAMAPTGTDDTNLSWGNLGGTVYFTASGQDSANNLGLQGNIVFDNKSSLTMTLTNNSTLSGAIDNTNTASSIILAVDSTSKWTATADSYVNTLSLASVDSIDAQPGVNIYVDTLSGVSISSGTQLPSGGYIYY